jgi:hypothetical protein
VLAEIAEPTDNLLAPDDVITALSHTFLGNLTGRLSLRSALDGDVALGPQIKMKARVAMAVRGKPKTRPDSTS